VGFDLKSDQVAVPCSQVVALANQKILGISQVSTQVATTTVLLLCVLTYCRLDIAVLLS
jgi:hypothetical protein